jgi:uroporphyrinogen decarboxylase
MTPKKRVNATFAYQTVDRVPVNYHANRGIDNRLKAYLGLKPDDDEMVCFDQMVVITFS